MTHQRYGHCILFTKVHKQHTSREPGRPNQEHRANRALLGMQTRAPRAICRGPAILTWRRNHEGHLRNPNAPMRQHQAAQSKLITLRLRRCRPAILQATAIQLFITNRVCGTWGQDQRDIGKECTQRRQRLLGAMTKSHLGNSLQPMQTAQALAKNKPTTSAPPAMEQRTVDPPPRVRNTSMTP